MKREAYLASQETRSFANDERRETNDEPAGRPTTLREMLDCKTRPQLFVWCRPTRSRRHDLLHLSCDLRLPGGEFLVQFLGELSHAATVLSFCMSSKAGRASTSSSLRLIQYLKSSRATGRTAPAPLAGSRNWVSKVQSQAMPLLFRNKSILMPDPISSYSESGGIREDGR